MRPGDSRHQPCCEALERPAAPGRGPLVFGYTTDAEAMVIRTTLMPVALTFLLAARAPQPLAIIREPADLRLVAADSCGPLGEELATAWREPAKNPNPARRCTTPFPCQKKG